MWFRSPALRIGAAAFTSAAVGVAVQVAGLASGSASAQSADLSNGLIKHVVVIYQENHTFDETLGAYCASRDVPCDGYIGPVYLKNRTVAPMTQSPDIVPNVSHTTASQATAIDHGAMDGWAQVAGCGGPRYSCLTYFTPDQIPNLAALADRFVVSDRTFTLAASPSWGGHLYAAAANLDGFTGDKPAAAAGVSRGPGWGCDSNLDATWVAPDGTVSQQPACVPKAGGGGPYRPSAVPHVSTIFDSLAAAGDSWKIYGAPPPSVAGGQSDGYIWSICPSFADCRYTGQVNSLVPTADVLTDAANGTLPSYSVLTPSWSSAAANDGLDTSQHNSNSMMAGDNWIGTVVSAIENGPDWDSTAIFITYDDCGCFYDHVTPPMNSDGSQQGPRVPMVIVSPYARAGFTDSTKATFASILAFTEHVFGLTPLADNDAEAYDYANSFAFDQSPLAPVRLSEHHVPASSIQYLKAHPGKGEDDVT